MCNAEFISEILESVTLRISSIFILYSVLSTMQSMWLMLTAEAISPFEGQGGSRKIGTFFFLSENEHI